MTEIEENITDERLLGFIDLYYCSEAGWIFRPISKSVTIERGPIAVCIKTYGGEELQCNGKMASDINTYWMYIKGTRST